MIIFLQCEYGQHFVENMVTMINDISFSAEMKKKFADSKVFKFCGSGRDNYF